MSVLVTNFTVCDAEGTLIYVSFTSLAVFAEFTEIPSEVGDVISGLGDAAYSGPADAAEARWVAFRKSSRAVKIMNVGPSDDSTRAVTAEQLREIADLVASRID